MHELKFYDRNGNEVNVNDEILFTSFGRVYFYKIDRIVKDKFTTETALMTFNEKVRRFVNSDECEKIPTENREAFLVLKKFEHSKIFNLEKA